MEYLLSFFKGKEVEKDMTVYHNFSEISKVKNYIFDNEGKISKLVTSCGFEPISSVPNYDENTFANTMFFGYKDKQVLLNITKVLKSDKNFYYINFYFNYKDGTSSIPITDEKFKILIIEDNNTTRIVKYLTTLENLESSFSSVKEFIDDVKDGTFKSKRIFPFYLYEEQVKYFQTKEDSFEINFVSKFNMDNFKLFIDCDEVVLFG
jgi:hypothetical protein